MSTFITFGKLQGLGVFLDTYIMRCWREDKERYWLKSIGGMWLYEGLVKVADGWFSSPKLAAFLGMANDATSAATPTAAL